MDPPDVPLEVIDCRRPHRLPAEHGRYGHAAERTLFGFGYLAEPGPSAMMSPEGGSLRPRLPEHPEPRALLPSRPPDALPPPPARRRGRRDGRAPRRMAPTRRE